VSSTGAGEPGTTATRGPGAPLADGTEIPLVDRPPTPACDRSTVPVAKRPPILLAKGHGTGNDFVLLRDPDGVLDLGPEAVRALCHRRTGFGADGVIRVVRSAALEDGAEQAGLAEWFMDYRNADGSVAQMCGNGVRVFVHYLVSTGLVRLDDGAHLTVGTRAGVKTVHRDGALLAVDLGPWRIVGGPQAVVDGGDVQVRAAGTTRVSTGLSVDLGNPHVVVPLLDAEQLRATDLREQPVLDPAPEQGSNVEFVVPPAQDGGDAEPELPMRVYERGVGETLSCGTGAAAAVLATRALRGGGPVRWWVRVPGGMLRVGCGPELIAGAHVELAGPAELVGRGELDPGWLAAHWPQADG